MLKIAVLAAYGLIILLLAAFIALLVYGITLWRESAAHSQQEDLRNFREWIAATSGWFAGLVAISAAIIGVNAISQQIAKASEQHLEAMKFQANDRILLAKKVQSGASTAHGNIAQLNSFIFDENIELSDDLLNQYIDAASFTISYIENDDLSENVYELLGRRPPIGSYEGVIKRWVEEAQTLLEVPEEQLSDGNRRGYLQRASGLLKMIEMDIEYVEKEARDFIKR